MVTDVLGTGAKRINRGSPWALTVRSLYALSLPAVNSVTVTSKTTSKLEWRCQGIVGPRPPDSGTAMTTDGLAFPRQSRQSTRE